MAQTPVQTDSASAIEDPPTSQPPIPPRGPLGSWFDRTFDSMRNRNLRILWIGTFLNFAGVMMNMTAQSVVAFDLSGSNRAVGAVMLGQGMSLLVISPFAGTVADRFSKRTTLIICQVILGLTFFLIGLAIATDVINIPMLAVGSFIAGTMFAMIRPLRNAYIGELADVGQRGNAVAVQQLAMTSMQIIAPFAAGILLGWDAVGASGTYYVMGGAFVFAIVTVLQLPPTEAPVRAVGGPSMLADTWEGMRYGWKHREIRWVLVGFVMLTLVGMPYMTLLPGYVNEVLGRSTASLGVLLGISALGGFLVSVATASLADSPRAPLVLTITNVLFAGALLGLSVAPNFAVAAVAALFLGAGASGFQMLNTAIALRAADLNYMGRVASLTMMTFSLSGIVAFPIGAAADAWGQRPVLAVMGIAVLGVAGALAVWKQRMLRADRAALAA